MKKYIAPEFKVAMFHKETVSTEDGGEMTASQLGMMNNTETFMNQATNSARVQKSINFNNAIQFK